MERRFGWDCHGLPAEMEAVKELELPTRVDIERYGIGRFNEYCQASVLRYTSEWERYVTRQARWVDFSNDYKTMDLSYMESVMWAFRPALQKGLAVRGLSGAALLLGVRDAALQFRDPPGQLLPFPPGPRGYGRVRARTRPTAGHPANELLGRPGCPCGRLCGQRPHGRCRPTWPWPSGRISRYAVLEADEARYVVAEARLEALRAGDRRPGSRAPNGWER